jgi:hypothetical protein
MPSLRCAVARARSEGSAPSEERGDAKTTLWQHVIGMLGGMGPTTGP